MKIFVLLFALFLAFVQCQEEAAADESEEAAAIADLKKNYCLDLDVLAKDDDDVEVDKEDDKEDDDEDDDDEEDRERRGLRDFFKKLERNLRPVGKPILQDAAGRLIRNGLSRFGFPGKRSVDIQPVDDIDLHEYCLDFKYFDEKDEKEEEKDEKEEEKEEDADDDDTDVETDDDADDDTDDDTDEVEKSKRDLAAADDTVIIIIKRDEDNINVEKRSAEDMSKRGLRDFFKKIERNLRPVGKPILQDAAGRLIRNGLSRFGFPGKRSTEAQHMVNKRGLRSFFKKIERRLRPIAKPILNAAAANAIVKGLAAVGVAAGK